MLILEYYAKSTYNRLAKNINRKNRTSSVTVPGHQSLTRPQILNLVHESKRTSVTPLYWKLGLEQSVASSHPGILRKAGIVIAEKDERSAFYSVNYRRLEKVGEIAEKLLKF